MSAPRLVPGRFATGLVSLVGAGPGDPELLTLRAVRRLEAVEVVVTDRLVHPAVLALAPTDAVRVAVGKTGGDPASAEQAEIIARLILEARRGRRVVRLKGGDPFVFGRGGEEALALQRAGVPWEVVPGLTAGIAACALAHIPVTHRGLARSVTFATGTSAGGATDVSTLGGDTLVLYMAVRRLAPLVQALIAAGRAPSTPAAIIEGGSLDGERVLEGTLLELPALAASARVGSPALVVIGEVVSLRAALLDCAASQVSGEVE